MRIGNDLLIRFVLGKYNNNHFRYAKKITDFTKKI